MIKDFLGKNYTNQFELTIFNQIKNRFTEIVIGDLSRRSLDEVGAKTESREQNGDLKYCGELLKLAYEQYPENIALICQDKFMSYKELYFRAILFSQKLKSCGINPQDKVLIYSENSIAFYVAYFAIWQIGAIAVPVNIFLHSKELAYIIKDATPAAIFCSNNFKHNITNLIEEKHLEDLPQIFTQEDLDLQAQTPNKIETAFPNFKIEKLQSDELCLLLYTSGTTGTPKGVMLSSKNVMTNAIQCYSRFYLCGLSDNERFFCVLPLFHVFAQNTCLWLPLISGATIIIVPKIDRKLILEGLKHKPTLFLGFPALYGLLCLMRNAPLASIKRFISGADMLPDKIRQGFSMIYGRKICAGYGLSEASPVVAVNYHNHTLPTHFVGNPVVGLECDIRDENGHSLPRSTIGTLWIRGDNIMMGYYKSPEATSKVLIDGWLDTGDLGLIDKNGNLAISGRTKDIIIHKGFNIYPAEIENVLLRHPCVFKVAVVGQEEPDSGQIPVAFVAVKSHEKGLEDSLRGLCHNNLAAYKVPRRFICVDDLPMSSTGKVDKKQLHI